MLLRHKTKESHDKQHATESTETTKVQRSTPNTESHQEPRSKHTDTVDRVLTQGKIVCRSGRQTSLFEKVRTIAREAIAGEVLDGPTHTHDFSSAEIGTLEAVPISSTLGDFLLESGGMHHHCNSLISIKVGLPIQGRQTQ